MGSGAAETEYQGDTGVRGEREGVTKLYSPAYHNYASIISDPNNIVSGV